MTKRDSTLVERVARAIGNARVAGGGNRLNDLASRAEAQAAIDACHAEELAEALCGLMAASVASQDFTVLAAMERAEAVLAKVDGEAA